MIIAGIPMALESVILGALLCITIIGIPFRPAAFQNGQTGFDALWRPMNFSHIIYRGTDGTNKRVKQRQKKFNLAALFAPTDMTEGSPGKRIVACHTYADWKYCTAAL